MHSFVITSEYAAIISEAVKSVCEVSHWVQDIFDKRENSLHLHRVQKLLKGQKTQVLTPGESYQLLFFSCHADIHGCSPSSLTQLTLTSFPLLPKFHI